MKIPTATEITILKSLTKNGPCENLHSIKGRSNANAFSLGESLHKRGFVDKDSRKYQISSKGRKFVVAWMQIERICST